MEPWGTSQIARAMNRHKQQVKHTEHLGSATSPVVRIFAFQAKEPGSIPGWRTFAVAAFWLIR